MTKDHMNQNQFLDFVKYRKYKIHFLLYLYKEGGGATTVKQLPQGKLVFTLADFVIIYGK